MSDEQRPMGNESGSVCLRVAEKAVMLPRSDVTTIKPKGAPMPADEMTPEETLLAFSRAFRHMDLDTMMTYMADDVTAFWPASACLTRLDKAGIRAQFATTIAAVRAAGGTEVVRTQADMLTQQFGDVAIVTFHLLDAPFGRRTFVLNWRWDRWLIVHIHGSSA
jgi:ketosteroid isomerase-like protein